MRIRCRQRQAHDTGRVVCVRSQKFASFSIICVCVCDACVEGKSLSSTAQTSSACPKTKPRKHLDYAYEWLAARAEEEEWAKQAQLRRPAKL